MKNLFLDPVIEFKNVNRGALRTTTNTGCPISPVFNATSPYEQTFSSPAIEQQNDHENHPKRTITMEEQIEKLFKMSKFNQSRSISPSPTLPKPGKVPAKSIASGNSNLSMSLTSSHVI